MELFFEWDEVKAESNYQKHAVTFIEAASAISDANAVTLHDALHSEDEDRFIDIGRSSLGRIIVTVYTERHDCIRIISARKATPAERRQYERSEYE
jgi:uncharacterized DUF497 family protein